MQATHIIPDLSVSNIPEARGFYVDYLGLSEEPLDLDWVTRFRSSNGQAVVQLVTDDASAPTNPAISVAVGDGVD